jgi:GNAT superfamily N-acetyltransferase
MGPVLRQAVRADLPHVVDTWVDAFSQDPYFRWVASDDQAYAAFAPAWMTFIAGLCFERGHTFVGDDVAVAWIPPDLALAGPEDFARGRTILAAHAGEARADDAVACILAAREHAMADPHWTLQYVGVSSSSTGRGRGAAAVAAKLDEIDRDGLPCGLTSTNRRNLPFYERLGFRVVAEVPSPDGRVTLRPMVRP